MGDDIALFLQSKVTPAATRKPNHKYRSFFFWASCSNHCLAALDLGADVEQPFGCLIIQNHQAMQYTSNKTKQAKPRCGKEFECGQRVKISKEW